MLIANDVYVYFTRGLFKQKIKALNGFSINVGKGDIYGLLGPNGAGKSTAMYCFLGLIKPDKGQVTLFGKNPEHGSALYEKIAYVPEEPHYHLYLTVEEAITFYASLYHKDIPKIKVSEAIEKVGLSEFRDLKMEKCSKEMKQKVGIATCLLNSPEIVFLDEPTRGLDPLISKEFRDMIIEMNRQGTTFVINSHILSEVEMVCNRVAIINKGRVVVQDELKNLLRYDLENYLIELDSVEQPPEYLTQVVRTGKRIKAQVSASRIYEFFNFAQQNNLKIYECSLKRLTLEEAFFSSLKGDRKDA